MLTYKVTKTGYRIYRDDELFMTQEGSFAKVYPGKTMEERAQNHMKVLTDDPTDREKAETYAAALETLGLDTSGDIVQLAGDLRKKCEAVIAAGKKLVTADKIDSTMIVEAMALLDEYSPKGINGDYLHEAGESCVKDMQAWKCIEGYNAKKNPGIIPGMAASNWVQYHTTDPARALPFVQPTDSVDAYMSGECALFEDGLVYESAKDNNLLSPAEAPDDWICHETVESITNDGVSVASLFED